MKPLSLGSKIIFFSREKLLTTTVRASIVIGTADLIQAKFQQISNENQKTKTSEPWFHAHSQHTQKTDSSSSGNPEEPTLFYPMCNQSNSGTLNVSSRRAQHRPSDESCSHIGTRRKHYLFFWNATFYRQEFLQYFKFSRWRERQALSSESALHEGHTVHLLEETR